MPSRHFKTFLISLAFFLVPALALAAEEVPAFSEALEHGPLYATLIAFAGGFAVSLTPCVYPMIAITVSVFGARQSKSKWHGFGLSSAFVVGILATFVPLGVFAALTGGLFGGSLQRPWVRGGVATLFILMSASMFGAFELALPSGLTNRLAKVGGMGSRGAFGLGMVCGLIAGPCTGPVLTGILAYIAQMQSILIGVWAMGAFGLGLGIPFLVVGTFAVQLPKSGPWMLKVKSVLGAIMAVVALYYFSQLFPELTTSLFFSWSWLSAAVVASLLGLLLGAVHLDFHSVHLRQRVSKAFGVLLLTIGTLMVVLVASAPERKLNWQQQDLQGALEQASVEKRPVLVDFSATWCGACKELDKVTFADIEVNQEAGRFIAVKIDATDDSDPLVEAAMKKMKVVGLPAVILLNTDGSVSSRFDAFVPPRELLEAMKLTH